MDGMSPLASRLGRAIGPLLIVATCVFSIDAAAQSKDPAAAARDLARAGWDALDKQDYKDALDKVTQAEGLYHAPTHLLLMGNAQAGLGKLVDALATFEKLAAEPLTGAAPNAFKEAQETGRKRMKELLARVPSLLVVVTSAEAAGVTVSLDGQKVTFAGGVAVRCDPGEHTIVVEAEGFPTVTQKVTLPEKGGVVRVPIALEKPGTPASTGTASAGPTASAAPSGTATVGPAPGPQIKPLTFVTLGVAGASLVVGAITGGITLGAASDLKQRCKDNHCPFDEKGAYDSANMVANVSTATFVIGGLAAAAGGVLLAVDLAGGRNKPPATTGPAPHGAAASVRIQPFLTVGGGGVRGSF